MVGAGLARQWWAPAGQVLFLASLEGWPFVWAVGGILSYPETLGEKLLNSSDRLLRLVLGVPELVLVLS